MSDDTVPSWVLDTNVIISGLLNPHGCPGRLLDMALARALRLTYDDRIEAEYREVMARDRFSISRERRESFLAILRFQDSVTALPWKTALPPDPDDLMFLEVALSAAKQTLVTGNARHFPPACRGPVRFLTPAEAWRELTGKTG